MDSFRDARMMLLDSFGDRLVDEDKLLLLYDIST